jgi:hypothetical protein
MKKRIWLSIVAASAVTAYFLVKKYMLSPASSMHDEKPANKHHLTTAFAKAKQRAVSEA